MSRWKIIGGIVVVAVIVLVVVGLTVGRGRALRASSSRALLPDAPPDAVNVIEWTGDPVTIEA